MSVAAVQYVFVTSNNPEMILDFDVLTIGRCMKQAQRVVLTKVSQTLPLQFY
jgi:hypothetical protein